MRLNDRARRWLPWALLAIAVIVTAAVYWPGVTGGWVFDDYPNIVDNAAVHITRGHASFAAWVNVALSSPASFLHRPLASITFALDWMQGDGNPWPFKVTNIIIHLLNGVLLFCMLRALLRLLGLRTAALPHAQRNLASAGATSGLPALLRAGTAEAATSGLPALLQRDGEALIDDAAATRLALIVSAAWMLLPINLMAVLYVVQRMESLCQVFVLAGLWAYLHGRWMMLTATEARRDRQGFALAVAGIVLGTLLGLTSKETAVLLPVFAFLAEWIVVGFGRASDNEGIRRSLRAGDPGSSVSDDDADGREHARSYADTSSPDRRSLRAGDPDANEHDAATDGREHARSYADTSSPDRRSLRAGDPNANEHDAATDGREHARSYADTSSPDRRSLRAGDPGANEHDAATDGREHARSYADTSSPDRGSPRADKRLWTLFTVTLFVPAVLGFLWLLRSALSPAAYSGRDFTLAQRLLTEPRVLVDYLHWTIFPNPEVLSLYHDEIVASTGLLAPWTTLGSMLLLAALVVIAVWLRKRRPLIALGIGWFFAAQLLTATIVPLELVYEQRMYFASIGVLLALGSLLLGLHRRINWPLLRGVVAAIALLWFATVTTLRAQEWSNPLKLAVIEGQRHPESPRAVYEAGRQLLIASNYQPGDLLERSLKFFEQASAIPGASALSDQALIMAVDHQHQGDDAAYWQSMTHKLQTQPIRQEDISALISLTNCYGNGICVFDLANLQRAYAAALSHPYPIARLYGAYAAFQRDLLHDNVQATKYLALAVQNDPSEPAYRIDLASLYARSGNTEQALEQIDALRRLNYGGRLDRQIAVLEQLAEQGQVPAH